MRRLEQETCDVSVSGVCLDGAAGPAAAALAASRLAPEEQAAEERSDTGRDRRRVRLAALDRRHRLPRLLLRDALAERPRQPAEHRISFVDDSHRSVLS